MFFESKPPVPTNISRLFTACGRANKCIAPGFCTYTNLTNTLIAASITTVTGLGMTFAIAMGGFDLSVGFLQVLTAITVAGLLSAVDPALAILGALLTGMVLGLLNGALISRFKCYAALESN
jgi:ribose transport system permease protein